MIAVLLLLLALLLLARTELFLHRAVRTTGILDRMDPVRDRNGTTYRPTFHFTTEQGVVVRVISHTSTSGGRSYVAGDTVPVLYDPSDPNDAEIDSFVRLWLAPLVVGGIGSVFALIFLVFRLLERGGAVIRVR